MNYIELIHEVNERVSKWKEQQMRKKQPCHSEQLQFTSEVVQYVSTIHKMTKINPGAKSVEKTSARSLPMEVPIYGPRFIPPTYFSLQKREPSFDVKPSTSYIRPLTVVHPYYFPELARCPQCQSDNIKWEGWNSYGYRDVHGLFHEETALGAQLSCKDCRQRGLDTGNKIHHCFATTNVIFWENQNMWEIPRKYFAFDIISKMKA